VRGEADDGTGTQLQTRVGRREIVLPDMRAGGSAHPREIDSIVHDDLRAVRFGRADDAVAQVEKWTRGKLLGAHLKKSCPAVEIRACKIVRPPAGTVGDFNVDDRLEICDW
jgi:hypothetical protein